MDRRGAPKTNPHYCVECLRRAEPEEKKNGLCFRCRVRLGQAKAEPVPTFPEILSGAVPAHQTSGKDPDVAGETPKGRFA